MNTKMIAAGAALLCAAQAFALNGKLVESTVPSENVPSPVAITYYLPKDYDPKRPAPYPLLIELHGGGGSNKHMGTPEGAPSASARGGAGVGGGMGGILDQAIERSFVPPMVAVMPSVGRSFYMNYRDGSEKWEDFVVKDLLAYMRKNFNVVPGRQGTFITGISMGGMGSLRMAVKHPDIFQAVASQEPGIEPALAYDDIQLRDRFWRSDALMAKIYGNPVDKAYWAENNPASIIKKDPQRLLGLGIYLEVGDQDMFFLDQGTEFVHRILFDNGISHEYRLVKGGEHVGASLPPRSLDSLAFIGRQIDPPHWIDETALRTRAMLERQKAAAGMKVNPIDPNRIHAD